MANNVAGNVAGNEAGNEARRVPLGKYKKSRHTFVSILIKLRTETSWRVDTKGTYVQKLPERSSRCKNGKEDCRQPL